MSEKKKILVGEDSSVIQNLTRKILSSQNFQIASAKNGKDVLDQLGKETYHLVLLDINMPKMNGMDCVKSIRHLENDNKQVPVIAAGYQEAYFKEAGFDDYMLKPLDFDSLVEIVKNTVR